MKVVYYTSGLSGAGRVVRGIAIGNAFRRKNIECEYVIMSSSPFGRLAGDAGFVHQTLPPEQENILDDQNYLGSNIYAALKQTAPYALLVDLLWFPLHPFIQELPCKKIFLCRQVDYRYFSFNHGNRQISFDPDSYDLRFAIEPHVDVPFKLEEIEPIVIRNRDEILPREEALAKLGLKGDQKTFLLAHYGNPGEFDQFKKKYQKLEKKGWRGVYSTDGEGGLFPTVDYFNVFDLVICGAGYNSFWEVRYFNKESIIIPTNRAYENVKIRMHDCKKHEFTENGADQLVDIIMGNPASFIRNK